MQGRGLKCSLRQLPNLFFDHVSNSVLGQIDLRTAHFERSGDLTHRLAQDDVQIINLVVLWFHFALDARQRGLEEVLLPFVLPDCGKFWSGWVRKTLDGARACPLLGLNG